MRTTETSPPHRRAPGAATARRGAGGAALALGILASGAGTGVAQAAPPIPPVSTYPHGNAASAAGAVRAQANAGAPTKVGSAGYWQVGTNGQVYSFGVPNYGDLRNARLNKPIVGMAGNGGNGYWLVASDGGIFSYGSAQFFGSTGGDVLNRPIVGMAATPSGNGYWLVASDGGVFAFGDAGFYGSTGSLALNKPVVAMAATPTGHGYWLVASDGGIFSFGDARFFGSTGSLVVNKPVVGISTMPDAGGYDLVASDGGIFSFGDAPFEGSAGSLTLNQPIVSAAATADGQGYWLAAADGGIFNYGDAVFKGSAGAAPIPAPVVAIAATTEGNPYPAGSTGYDISFPQFAPDCTSPNLPPSGSPVSIVGVNGGLSNTLNPCFAQEAAWAGSNMTVYINVDNLTAQSAAASYATGQADATADVAYVESQGFRPQIWWLDVEGNCGSGNVLWQCGSGGQMLNNQVIQGALSVLAADGLTAGVYSTYIQWPDIVGNVSLSGTPIWIATVPTSAQQWAADCTQLAFAGGTPYLVQWLGGYTASGFDEDYACAT